MKYLAIIPARYDSSRFPGKPLAKIGDKTMIERVYREASKVFENLYVATDNSQIYESVLQFGGRVVMTSASHTTGTSRAAEAMLLIEKLRGIEAKYLINIQGDEPFIKPEQLRELIGLFENSQTEVATLAKRVEESEELFSADVVKVVMGREGEALYFSRSPIPYYRGVERELWLERGNYYRHIGLYGFKREALIEIGSLKPTPLEEAESLEQLRWLEGGYRITVGESLYNSYSVDVPNDIIRLKERGFF